MWKVKGVMVIWVDTFKVANPNRPHKWEEDYVQKFIIFNNLGYFVVLNDILKYLFSSVLSFICLSK